jgi:hypothetical protein
MSSREINAMCAGFSFGVVLYSANPWLVAANGAAVVLNMYLLLRGRGPK